MILRALDHLAHDRTLALPRRRHRFVRDVRVGHRGEDRRQRPLVAGEQIEQVRQRRGRVVRGEERRPDEAALLRRREVDAPLLRDLHEVRGRELRPDDRGAVPLGDALGLAAHRDRQRDLRVRTRRAHELDDHEQRLIRR